MARADGRSSDGINFAPGQLRAEFAALRRRRALFRLSAEGENVLCMSSDPGSYVVAAWYEDGGYRGEPLRARAVMAHHDRGTRPVPFTGRTPEDLLDLMESACAEADAGLAA